MTDTAAITTKRYYTLGTTTVVVRDSAGGGSLTSAGGAPVVQRYLPYGGIRSSNGTQATDRGFIGQTKDGSTGLQYLNARYYDPAIGRFTAGDPLADLIRPASLDAYGYGYGDGNPTTLSDPTGLRPTECNDTGWECSGSNSGGWAVQPKPAPRPPIGPPAPEPPPKPYVLQLDLG